MADATDAVMEILRRIQADLAVVKRQGTASARLLEELMTESRMIKAAVDDIATLKVSPGEIGALHHEVNQMKRSVAEIIVRIEELEAQRSE